MARLAISAIGRDRPGIVAAVAEDLVRHGVNVEDSQMTILRGHFTMTLVVAAPDELDRDALAADLHATADRLGLAAMSLSDVEQQGDAPERPTHLVSVYGADHPGIVHAVAVALAERAVNICDLQTRLLAEQEEPVYVMLLEVALPAGMEPPELEAALGDIAAAQQVEATLHPLEEDPL